MITLVSGLDGLWIGLGILGGVGLIALLVFLFKKFAKPFHEEKPHINQEEVAKEELDRLLVPIEDDETKKEMQEYDENKDK